MAGAGPSTAIASTIPRNDAPIRKRLALRTMKSLPSTSTRAGRRAPGGCHWSAVDSSDGAEQDDDEQRAWPTTTASCGGPGAAGPSAGPPRAVRRAAWRSLLPGRAHQRERPRDDHQPQDDGQPDDHYAQGSALRPRATGQMLGLPMTPGVELECGAFHSAGCSDVPKGRFEAALGATAGFARAYGGTVAALPGFDSNATEGGHHGLAPLAAKECLQPRDDRKVGHGLAALTAPRGTTAARRGEHELRGYRAARRLRTCPGRRARTATVDGSCHRCWTSSRRSSCLRSSRRSRSATSSSRDAGSRRSGIPTSHLPVASSNTSGT